MDHTYANTSDTENTRKYRTKSHVVYCFVPMCPSNSLEFPNKLFITGPVDPNLRNEWYAAARTRHKYSPKTILRCCEDHFDLEKDIANWVKYKLMGGKLFIKKGVVPHYFDCQNRMNRTKYVPLILKRKRNVKINRADSTSANSPLTKKGSRKIKTSKENNTQMPIETQEPQTTKTNKSSTKTNNKSTRTSARSKKQTDVSTSNVQSGTEDHLSKSSETQEPQTANATKSSGTKTNNKTTRSTRSNKQTDVPTSDVRNGTDDHAPEVMEEPKSSDNNTSNTEVSGNNKRKKETDNVKLPEAEELIASVYKFLQAEYEFLKYYIGDICDLSPLINVLKRTADACGVCKNTVRSIVDKKLSESDLRGAGPAKRAKFRQQVLLVSKLAEEESSCDESDKEQNEVNKQMDDDSSIKVEESSSSSDSDDELQDDTHIDDDSDESDECEVEASMDVDGYGLRLHPVLTQPVEVKTETTDVENLFDESDECEVEASMDVDGYGLRLLDPLKTELVEVKTETTDMVNPQLHPVLTQPVEVKTETTELENLLSNSDVIPMASLAPVKTELDDNSIYSDVVCTRDIVSDISCDIKCEPPGLG